MRSASAASADVPSADGQTPAETAASPSILLPEAPPDFGEIADASPLLAVLNARGAAGDGARALTSLADHRIDLFQIGGNMPLDCPPLPRPLHPPTPSGAEPPPPAP